MPAKGRGNLRRAVPPAAHCRKLPAFEVAPFLRLRCFHVVILPAARGRQHWEIYGCHLEFARQAEAWIVEERLPVFRRQIGVGWSGLTAFGLSHPRLSDQPLTG